MDGRTFSKLACRAFDEGAFTRPCNVCITAPSSHPPPPVDSAVEAAARLTCTTTSALEMTEVRGAWSRAANKDEHPAVFMKKKKKSRTLVQKDEVREKIARLYATPTTARATMPARVTK
jgi:hypothetical protein